MAKVLKRSFGLSGISYRCFGEAATPLHSLKARVPAIGEISPAMWYGSAGAICLAGGAWHLQKERKANEELRSIFGCIDTDRSGYLSPDEIRAAFAIYDVVISDRQLEEMFKRADTNHDGKISFEEFKAARDYRQPDWALL